MMTGNYTLDASADHEKNVSLRISKTRMTGQLKYLTVAARDRPSMNPKFLCVTLVLSVCVL